MCDDALIDDDLLGVDDSLLLDDDILDDRLLDEEHVASPITLSAAPLDEPSLTETKKNPVKPLINSNSDDVVDLSDDGLDGELLDYEDDIDDEDRDRREDKFTSERSEKTTSIDDLLPQQKSQTSDNSSKTFTAPSVNTESKGRGGGYQGRYQNNRGNFRPRGGFRPGVPPFPLNMSTFPMPNMGIYPRSGPPPHFAIGMNPMGGPPPNVLPFAPNVPAPVMPSQMQNNNWNRRVEAFVRQTTEQNQPSNRKPRSRSRSGSYSASSSCTCSCSSRSSSPSTRRNDKDRRRHDGARRDDKSRKPGVDDTKIADECAKAVGVDQDYVKKLEEQKRAREEIRRRKAQRFGATEGESKLDATNATDAKRKRAKSPESAPTAKNRRRSSRSRSPRSSQHRHKHSHHRHHSSRRREPRSTSLERLAKNALQSINQAAGTGNNVLPTTTNVLPPMNVPPPFNFNVPPPIVRPPPPPTTTTKTSQFPIPTPLPVVPQIRTVSTVTLGNADRPSVVMNAPPPDAKERKLKAQLVVVVSNVIQIPGALKRISMIATSVGATKKVWQATGDSICIIFKSLDVAKVFLTGYHNKILSSQRLDVSLHKMYLNLDTMPV